MFVNRPGLPSAHQQILCYEANFLMQLAHPNIVQGREIITGRGDEPWCVVMEALRGRCIFADLSMRSIDQMCASSCMERPQMMLTREQPLPVPISTT